MVYEERVYTSNLPIKYVLEKSDIKSDFLVVVFSAFNSKDQGIQHSYNYMRTLKNININKLFILDNYGPRGSYYLGEKMKLDVETSIFSLITYIARMLDISLENIITVGSSKGGSAALYFGLKYNLGHIIAGAPQTRISNYIQEAATETADYMLGIERKSENIEALNQIIYRQLNKEILTHIHMLSSVNDAQYKGHIEPFLNCLNEKNIPIDILIDNEMKSHADIAQYYPKYLNYKLLEVVYGVKIKDIQLVLENEKVKIQADIQQDNYFPLKLRCVAYTQDSKMIDLDKECEAWTLDIDVPMHYRFAMQLYNDEGLVYEEEIYNSILGGQYFDFIGVEYKVEDSYIDFKINIVEKIPVEYAFYILKEGQVVKKYWYQKESSLRHFLDEDGRYQVVYFIRVKNSFTAINKIPPINFNKK